MMDTLRILLREYGFRGQARHVRCFAHTLNLTAKATICQFERKIGKKKTRKDNNDDPDFDNLLLLEAVVADEECDDEWDNADEDLDEIPGLIDIDDDDDGAEEAAKDEEEIINVFETLTVDEQERWKVEVKPIRSALHKVSLSWCDASLTHVIHINRHVASPSRFI
jgi:hypothetical protein